MLRISLFLASLFPTLVFAQANVEAGINNIGGLIKTFNDSVVRNLAALCLTAAVAAFFAGIVQYIWGKRNGSAEKTKLGADFMLWGLVALFVMFSVWGIVKYAQGVFGIQNKTDIEIPQIRFTEGNTSSGSQNTNPLPTGVNNSNPCNGASDIGKSCNNGDGMCVQNSGGAFSCLSRSSLCSGKTEGASCADNRGKCVQQVGMNTQLTCQPNN